MRALVSATLLIVFTSVGLALHADRSQGHSHGPHGHSDGHGHSHGPHEHSHGPHAGQPVPEVEQRDRRLLAGPAPSGNAQQNAARRAVGAALIDHDFRRALSAAEPWLRSDRFDAWTLMAASDAHLELGQLEDAEVLLQRVLDVKPTPPTYFRAAYLLHLRGHDPDAIAAMQLALEGLPQAAARERAWTLTELGDLQRHAGEHAAAEASYRRALANAPSWSQARVGLAYCARARGDLPEAAELLREVEPSVEVLNQLALVEAALGQARRARQTFAAACELGERDHHYARALAHALADHGTHTARAVALARRELGVRPNAHPWDALAHALWADGQASEALEAARRALAAGTREPQILFHAGLAAFSCSAREEARAWLREAYRRDPGLRLHPQAPALNTL